MRVLIAPDSFKECLNAQAVAAAIATGWRRAFPNDDLLEVPLADGGEGTTVALVNANGGSLHACSVTGPMGQQITAHYGLIDDAQTAVIEVAEASGLHLVEPARRNAVSASSFGTGELILAALATKPTRLIIGLGGSATTDAGVGMLQALGGRFTDVNGQEIGVGGGELLRLSHIDVSAVKQRLVGIDVLVATDVNNPLLGARGTAAIFAKQKGADANNIEQLEKALQHYASCARTHGFCVDDFPGSGAAGGIGGTLSGMFGAKVVAGVDTVIAAVGLAAHMQTADLVITAEGSMDAQSAAGKTPAGVCRLALAHGVPVIGLAGMVGDSLDDLYALGLSAVFSIAQGPLSRDDALANAAHNLAVTAEQIARLVHRMGLQVSATNARPV